MTESIPEIRTLSEGKNQVDMSWKTLYKVGGIACLVEGVAYLMLTAMGPMIGVAPGNTLTWLNALATHPQLAVFDYGVVTGIADFVLIPAALALYFALRGVSKSWMLVATGIILTYVAIDISTFVSEGPNGSLTTFASLASGARFAPLLVATVTLCPASIMLWVYNLVASSAPPPCGYQSSLSTRTRRGFKSGGAGHSIADKHDAEGDTGEGGSVPFLHASWPSGIPRRPHSSSDP